MDLASIKSDFPDSDKNDATQSDEVISEEDEIAELRKMGYK